MKVIILQIQDYSLVLSSISHWMVFLESTSVDFIVDNKTALTHILIQQLAELNTDLMLHLPFLQTWPSVTLNSQTLRYTQNYNTQRDVLQTGNGIGTIVLFQWGTNLMGMGSKNKKFTFERMKNSCCILINPHR